MGIPTARRQDLLQTLVVYGILLTPGWLGPNGVALPWAIAVTLLYGAPALYLTWRHAPWVPTPSVDSQRILDALEVQPDEWFGDLGCGDGRMVLQVWSQTGARATGIEAAPLLFVVGWLRARWVGDPRLRIELGDVHRADLARFDAVYVWGTSRWIDSPAFRTEVYDRLKPGARLVSYHQPIPGLEPVRVDREGRRPIFVYRRQPTRRSGAAVTER